MPKPVSFLYVLVSILIVALVLSNVRVQMPAHDGDPYELSTLREQVRDQQEKLDDQQAIIHRLTLADLNQFWFIIYGDKADYMVSTNQYPPFTGPEVPGDTLVTKYSQASSCNLGEERCMTVYLLRVVDGEIQIVDKINLADLGVRPGDEVEAWYAKELGVSESLVPDSPRNHSPSYWRQTTGLAIAITHVDGGATGAVIK